MDEIIVRPAEITDTNFILSTWLREYFKNSGFTIGISSPLFFEYHQRVVKRIMARDTTRVLVAALSDDPFVIIGYLVYELPEADWQVAHICFVKVQFRKFGIAKELLKESELDTTKTIEYTHRMRERSKEGRYSEMHWLYEKLPSLTYNPYLI
jgi:hypothetical protein